MGGEFGEVVDGAGADGDGDGVVAFEDGVEVVDEAELGVEVGVGEDERLCARHVRLTKAIIRFTAGDSKGVRVGDDDRGGGAELLPKDLSDD